MAPSSLAATKKGRSTSSIKPTTKHVTTTTTAPDAILSQIQLLTSQLPPAAPSSSSSLNPLADLVQLFNSLPLSLPPTATVQQQQLNRQQVHTALHSLKAIFQHLIQQGRLHGILKAKKAKLLAVGGVEVVQDQSVLAVKQWLNQRFAEFLAKAALVVGQHWDTALRVGRGCSAWLLGPSWIPANNALDARRRRQVSSLNALMSLLRHEASFLTSLHSSRQAQFPTSTFAHIVRGILIPTPEGADLSPEIKEEWLKWFNRDDDIRYHFLKGAGELVQSFRPSSSSSSSSKTATTTAPIPARLSANLITLLESLTTMPTSPSELNSFWCSTPLILKAPKPAASKKRKALDDPVANDGSTGVFDSSSESEAEPEQKLTSRETKKLVPALLSLSAHRKVFQECWLSVLGLPMEEGEAKRVLVILHRQVLPHMTDAKRLMDWLVDCADAGEFVDHAAGPTRTGS